MGLETVSFIPELVITNPIGASDPKSQGDDHLRNIKKAIKGTFPNFVGTAGVPKTVTATEDQLNAAVAAATLGTTSLQMGLTTIPVMASAMISTTTNGAAIGAVETTTNKLNYKVLDFDTTTQEFACFSIPMPKNWDDGTVTFQPLWTFASSSGGVVWALQGVATSDGDTLDVAYGTEQTSSDTALTAGQCHVGPTSAAITIAGTPTLNDLIHFRIKRNVADGGDTLGADARLIGIRLFFTTNLANDS